MVPNSLGPGELLMHFGTARAVRNASLADLQKAPGVSAAVAQQVADLPPVGSLFAAFLG